MARTPPDSDSRTGSAPDFSELAGDLYREWERAMSAWWDEVVESPAFLSAMGGNLASHTRARESYEQHVDRSLEQLHLPTRGDLVRLAKVASRLEDRLVQVEEQLAEVDRRLASLERDSLEARLNTAEALIQLQERVNRLERGESDDR